MFKMSVIVFARFTSHMGKVSHIIRNPLLLPRNTSKSISETVKYAYKLEVWEGVKCDTYDFPAHILSYRLRTTPGTVYKVNSTSNCHD